MRRHTVGWAIAAVLLVAAPPEAPQTAPAQQFRSGIVLIPIDVRVVDKNGDPVTDLSASDFTVRENGVIQQIAHFRPWAAGTAVQGTLDSTDAAFGALATTRRTFVIVLGRGRLNYPTRALDALIEFVRQTLPGDQIGVVAYLHAVGFNTDKEAVARFLEKFRLSHEAIEAKIARDMRQGTIPRTYAADTRAAIDALFGVGGTADVVSLPGASATVANRYNDLGFLKGTLEHLRQINGQKHLIFTSEHRFGVGNASENPTENYLVRLAAGAQTTLSFIHSGGLTGPSGTGGRVYIRTSTGSGESQALAAQKVVAEQTGGTSVFYEDAASSLAALERITAFQYLLGYYPASAAPDGQFRVIQVSVARPGVTVLYRHAYLAKPQPPAVSEDEYRRALTEERIAAGLAMLVNPKPTLLPNAPVQWGIRVAATVSMKGNTDGQATVTIGFDPTVLAFQTKDDFYTSNLDLALFADDNNRTVVGASRQRINIRLSAADYARSRREWVQHHVSFGVAAYPSIIRAVLYDFETDNTGAAQVRVRK